MIHDLVVFLSAGGSTAYAVSGESSQGSVYRFTDGGSTWTDLIGNGLPSDGWFYSLAVDPSNTDIVFAASWRPAANA